jgi:hypothetical protein
MISQDMAMGLAIVAVCCCGLIKLEWLMHHSRNCQRLAELWGPNHGRGAVRFVLLAGIVVGSFLAAGWIHPWRWD